VGLPLGGALAAISAVSAGLAAATGVSAATLEHRPLPPGGVHGDIRAAHSRLAEHIAVGERLLPRRDEVIPIDRTQGLMTVVPVTAQLSWQLRQQEAAAKPCPLRIQFPLIVVTAGLLVVCDAKGAQPLVCHRLEGGAVKLDEKTCTVVLRPAAWAPMSPELPESRALALRLDLRLPLEDWRTWARLLRSLA